MSHGSARSASASLRACVSPYPKEQRSPAAAQALLCSEIARGGKVVRDNDIQPSTQ
jgi:hypothetical protein